MISKILSIKYKKLITERLIPALGFNKNTS